MARVRRHLALTAALISTWAWANSGPQRVTIQRDPAGAAGNSVVDCYIWEESPDSNGNSTTLYVGLVGTTDKVSFLRFDLSGVPADAQVHDARLVLQTIGTSGTPIRVHEVTAPWAETEPTWTTFSTKYAPTAVTTFTPVAGRVSVDLTALARRWVSGATSNLGIALVQDPLKPSTTFDSSEEAVASLRPALELVIEPPPAPVEPLPLVGSQVPALEASCGVPFRYPLKVHTPGATQYSVSSQDGLAIDPATGELTWTPDRSQRGAHEWMVSVTDGTRTDLLPVQLEVRCSEPLKVGCQAAPAGALGLLALAVATLRWRRRRH